MSSGLVDQSARPRRLSTGPTRYILQRVSRRDVGTEQNKVVGPSHSEGSQLCCGGETARRTASSLIYSPLDRWPIQPAAGSSRPRSRWHSPFRLLFSRRFGQFRLRCGSFYSGEETSDQDLCHIMTFGSSTKNTGLLMCTVCNDHDASSQGRGPDIASNRRLHQCCLARAARFLLGPLDV